MSMRRKMLRTAWHLGDLTGEDALSDVEAWELGCDAIEDACGRVDGINDAFAAMARGAPATALPIQQTAAAVCALAKELEGIRAGFFFVRETVKAYELVLPLYEKPQLASTGSHSAGDEADARPHEQKLLTGWRSLVRVQVEAFVAEASSLRSRASAFAQATDLRGVPRAEEPHDRGQANVLELQASVGGLRTTLASITDVLKQLADARPGKALN
jgi:hypothetical protein